MPFNYFVALMSQRRTNTRTNTLLSIAQGLSREMTVNLRDVELADYMSHNRFQTLLSSLHFKDNTDLSDRHRDKCQVEDTNGILTVK